MLTALPALLLAKLIVDAILPNERPHYALRIALITTFSATALGFAAWPLALAAAAVHAAIELVARALPKTLGAYIAQQVAHIAALGALAQLLPHPPGLWAGLPMVPAYTFTCGALIATLTGGPAIGLLMARFTATLPEGLSGAGRLIGLLERALIFTLVMVGEPAGIGFLIAAKSILRFDTAKDHRASEYVIVGTLASFGWALIASLLTIEALEIVRAAP